MNVDSVVTINFAKLRQLDSSQIVALEQTAEALHTDVVQAQIMPRDSGTLQNESTFTDNSQSSRGKVAVVTSTPYARRLYYHPEYNFSTDKNPNAEGNWYKDYLKGGTKQDYCTKVFKQLYKKESGL